MDTIIVDTGVWYAICDHRDSYHRDAQEKAELLSNLKIAFPWPIAYETLRTKFVRNKMALRKFESFLKSLTIEFVEDDGFREKAFELSLDHSLRQSRPLSLADCLVRLMLDDVQIRVAYLATFNAKDFHDICHKRSIEIV